MGKAPGDGDAGDAEAEIVGAVDEGDGTEKYVIADLSADGAWLSMHHDDAPALPAWR